MFYTDSPIETKDKDVLSRGTFVHQLTETIINQPTQDSFVVGLYGSWGSGKTSILNLLEESINRIIPPDSNPFIKVIRFDPWGYVDSTQLINQFFALLATELKHDEKDKQQIKIGEALEKYAFSLEFTKSIPAVGSIVGLIPGLAETIGKSMKERAKNRDSSITHQKNNVITELKKRKCRYVIFIDDIDRLPNEQIRMIFQLVKAIADFPYITYVLSFDKPVVVRALQRVQDCNGDEYLEKIIQVPFSIPNIQISKIQTIFYDRLSTVIDTEEKLFDNKLWYQVSDACILPYIKSLRDINRYMNVLEFKYAPLRYNINPVDFAGLTSLEVFATHIYEWIKQNKGALTKSDLEFSGTNGVEQAKKKEFWLERIKNICPDTPEHALNAITTLFPKIAFETNYPYDTIHEEQLSSKLRIGSSARFDTYFTLQFENDLVTYTSVLSSVNDMIEEDLRTYLEKVLKSGGYKSFLVELRHLLDSIQSARILLLLKTLFSFMKKIPNDAQSPFEWSTIDLNKDTCSKLLKKVTDLEVRFSLICEMVEESDRDNFFESASIVIAMEYPLGRLGSMQEDDNDIILSQDFIERIEKVFVARIKEISRTYNILDSRCFKDMAHLWDFIDQKSYSTQINGLLESPRNVLLYIAGMAYKGFSLGEGTTWKFYPENDFSTYITQDLALSALNSQIENGSVLQLSHELQVRLAAFVLSNSKQKTYSFNAVPEIDAEKLVSEWYNKH